MPERAIANARLTYATPDHLWEVSLNITNLFDKYYIAARQENIINFGVAQDIVGRPREWSASVKRSF